MVDKADASIGDIVTMDYVIHNMYVDNRGVTMIKLKNQNGESFHVSLSSAKSVTKTYHLARIGDTIAEAKIDRLPNEMTLVVSPLIYEVIKRDCTINNSVKYLDGVRVHIDTVLGEQAWSLVTQTTIAAYR
ncbi:MAG TPA: hypothetical protein VIY48_19645 [Candidatus Paceibacterota bacterium]